MIYQVRHITSYHYSEPVSMCHNLLHLRPRICRDQRCIQTRVQVEPMPRQVHEHQDYFGNPVSAFSIQNPHKVMTIVAEHLVERNHSEGQDVPDMPWEQAREILRSDKSPHNLEAYQFTFPSRYVPLGRACAICLRIFSAGQADDPIDTRTEPENFSGVQVRSTGHHHIHSHPGCIGQSQGSLPGFRSPDDRMPEVDWARGALCEWLPAYHPASWQGKTGGRRCHPRLAFSLSTRLWLGRF